MKSQRYWVRYPVRPHALMEIDHEIFSKVSFPLLSIQESTVFIYWRKYGHLVLVIRLGWLSLPRNNVVRLTDRPDLTTAAYRGRKATIQHNFCRDVLRVYLLISIIVVLTDGPERIIAVPWV